MAGTFDVDFAFEETRAVAAGYELHEAYHSEANEVVLVLMATPTEVSLQHVLLIAREEGPPVALKHWRQDWVFEDTELLEFKGDRVWEHRSVPPEQARCTWSQAVYQVDDGPRYESFGTFEYREDGTGVWTSAETWRPLPRREYTKRDDYDVLIAINRHVIGADGWRHEQQNVKWVLEGSVALVEETGLNTYRRAELSDASVATEYMNATDDFWTDVREEWSLLLDSGRVVRVRDRVGGTRLHLRLFPKAEAMSNEKARVRRRYVSDTLGPYVEQITAWDSGSDT